MKKILTLVLILSAFQFYAQTEFTCENINELVSNRSNRPDNALPIDPNKKYVINVFFHILNDDNGNNNINHPYGITEVMRAVGALNKAFNEHNIFFKYIGYEIINSTAFTNLPFTAPHNYDGFNIYFANYVRGNSAGSLQGNTKAAYTYDVLESPYFDFAIVHEIGHNLNLLHTFTNYNTNECEHVTRNHNDPNYNADVEGDLVEDTAATYRVASLDFDGCKYIYNSTRVDCQGTPYDNIRRGNFMGYETDGFDCYHFSTGQTIRMKEYLENPPFPHILQTLGTVESLYEPYDEQLVVGNTIISSEELPDGSGVEVCRNYIYRRKYQQGFDYVFTNTEPNSEITADRNTLFHYDDRTNHTINVRINQIDPNIYVTSSSVETLLPFACGVESFVSGTIYSMQVLGSMNITVKELDNIQVKDPNLYESLMQQYYNILRKMTESGLIKQTIIYKE